MSKKRAAQDPHDQVGAADAESQGQAALHSAEREAALLLALSQALATWDSFEVGGERLLRGLAEALGLTAGVLWLPQDDVLVARAIWGVRDIDRTALERALHTMRLPIGVGLPGRAWERREPIDRGRPSTDTPLLRSRAPLDGLSAAVGVPALAGEEMLAVVELYSASEAELGERLMHVLIAVGHVLGAFFARRRGQLMLSSITARETEVLVLVAHGLAAAKIAEQLSISRATVKTHLEHIYMKLGVSNRASAVASALRAGLIA
jgi:DNA-binding CsgD family transcriptional regulator